MEACYPGIAGQGFKLLMGIYTLALGGSQLAFPPGNVEDVIKSDKTLAPFRIEFEAFLSEQVESLYRATREHGAWGSGSAHRNQPARSRAVSARRLQKPYSLSYQAATEIMRLPITPIKGRSTMEERVSPTIRDEAYSSSKTPRIP